MGDIKGEETQNLCSRKCASVGRYWAYQKGVILFLCVSTLDGASCKILLVQTCGMSCLKLWKEAPLHPDLEGSVQAGKKGVVSVVKRHFSIMDTVLFPHNHLKLKYELKQEKKPSQLRE